MDIIENIRNKMKNGFYSAKRVIVKYLKIFLVILSNKVKVEQEQVSMKKKSGTLFEIIETIEKNLYENKVLKNIMPFIEYILIVYLCVLFVFDFIFGKYHYGIMLYSLLPLVLCGLCFIKRKYPVVIFSLLVLIIERIIKLIMFLYSISSFNKLSLCLLNFIILDLFVLIYITYKTIRIWLISKEGIKMRYKIADWIVAKPVDGDVSMLKLYEEQQSEHSEQKIKIEETI